MQTQHTLSFVLIENGDGADITVNGNSLGDCVVALLTQMRDTFSAECFDGDPALFTAIAGFINGEHLAYHGTVAGRGSVTVHRFNRRDFSTPEDNFDLVWTQKEMPNEPVTSGEAV